MLVASCCFSEGFFKQRIAVKQLRYNQSSIPTKKLYYLAIGITYYVVVNLNTVCVLGMYGFVVDIYLLLVAVCQFIN